MIISIKGRTSKLQRDMNPLLNFNTNIKIQRPNIPVDNEDVEYIESRMKNICAVLNMTLVYIKNQIAEVINPEYPNAIYAQNLAVGVEVKINSSEVKIGINQAGDKVLFRGLTIKVARSIDRITEKVSYDMHVSADGCMYRAGGRIKELIDIGRHYEFADTVEQLPFSGIVDSVKQCLDFRRLTKGQTDKLIEKFSDELIKK